MNGKSPSVFCFPNKKELLAALEVEQYGLDMTGEMFLMDLFVVIKQLLDWPPAWAMVIEVLDPAKIWTTPYCDKIMGSPWWSATSLVRKSYVSPRHTLAQIEKDAPLAGASMNRWLEALGKSGNSYTRALLQAFKANDTADVKNRSVHARPLILLMQQAHAKMVQHTFGTACKGSAAAVAKLQRNDSHGLTALHHAASQGDGAGAKAILKSLPKHARAEFAAIRDEYGYRAEDWAVLGEFQDAVEAIQSSTRSSKVAKAPESDGEREAGLPLASALFQPPAAMAADADGAGGSSEQCAASYSGGPGACAPASDGGWSGPSSAAAVADWMPAAERPCFADVIDASQFDFGVFARHYLLHPRPLLVRRGAELSLEDAKNFSREGVLAAAGDRKVEAQRFQTEKEFDGTKPLVKTMQEYVTYLAERPEGKLAAKLHYASLRLSREESYLNFSAILPKLIEGKVDHVGTTFYLGGALMGTPPHHHGSALNSLIFGRKVWFMAPPARMLTVHEPMHDFLVRTQGAPGFGRCLQEAGDLLYVPRGWTHGTLCLEDCAGMAHEIVSRQWELLD